MESNVQEIFLNEKPAQVLIKIRRNRNELNMSDIQKKIDTTYAHTVKVINRLEDKGLLTTTENGRSKTVELTEEGKQIVRPLAEFMEATEKVSN